IDRTSVRLALKIKTLFAFMAVIVLTIIAHGQQVDPISELVRANDIFLKLAVQLNNLPTHPPERIANCQTFLPQLDDPLRSATGYGAASGKSTRKIRIQAAHDSVGLAILSIMADSERQLAHPASPATP